MEISTAHLAIVGTAILIIVAGIILITAGVITLLADVVRPEEQHHVRN